MGTLRFGRGLRIRRSLKSCCGGLTCWRKLKTHLPGKQLSKLYIIAFVNLFALSFSTTMLFPFLPFMIQFLVPGVDETAVGRYAGVLAGIVFGGRIFASYLWGVVADKKGRKPVIVWSTILTSICVLAFGFSVNLPMAVIIRFLMGLFNGTVTCFKAMISEASDDKFQAFGLSIIGASWSFGFILGPAVSGVIADPVGQYNLTITNSFLHSYLTKFPFSLPCIVSAFLFIVGLIPAAFCLPETLGKKRNRKRSEINQMELELLRDEMGVKKSHQRNDDILDQELNTDDRTKLLDDDETEKEVETAIVNGVTTKKVGISNPLHTLSVEQHEHNDEQNKNGVVNMIETGEDENEANTKENSNFKGHQETEQRKSLWHSLKRSIQSSLKDLSFFMCHKVTLIPLVVYMVFSFAVIGFNEMFSIWAFTQPHYGGLGFSLHEIGIVLTIVGVFQLPLNLFAFAILEKYLKTIKVFYLGVIILTFTVLMLPHLHYMVNTAPFWLLMTLLIAVVFVLSSAGSLLFSAIFLFINNSVTFDKLGSINGLAMTLTSMTRCVAPVLVGLFFSFSLSDATLKIGFPLDYNFIFVMFSIIYLSCVFLVASLPESINHQKIIEDV